MKFWPKSGPAAALGAMLLVGGLALAAGAQPAGAMSSVDKSGFRDVGPDLIHDASGMLFPARVGSAVRQPIDATDVQDEYVTVRYQLPLADGGHATARIGIMHIEAMTPREHYAAYSPVILRRMPGAKVVLEGPFAIPGAPEAGYRGWFAGTDHAAGLITADFGHWSARLISDYPLAQTEAAQAAITAFVTALDWSALQKAADQ